MGHIADPVQDREGQDRDGPDLERFDGAVTDAPIERGPLSSDISNGVVKLFADYLGRGPTKARTVIARDVITVVLQDTLTKAERLLLERGEAGAVMSMRRTIQDTMREELVGLVEAITGRKVAAFLSDHQADPDFAAETFVLEPGSDGKERADEWADRGGDGPHV